MTEAEVEAEVRAHAERNEALVRQILSLGIDLAEMRAVDLHFLAPSKGSAETLVEALRRLGFDHLELGKRSLFGRTRSVTIKANLSVNQVTDSRHIERLVRAAAQAGAIHDGWGMPVTSRNHP